VFELTDNVPTPLKVCMVCFSPRVESLLSEVSGRHRQIADRSDEERVVFEIMRADSDSSAIDYLRHRIGRPRPDSIDWVVVVIDSDFESSNLLRDAVLDFRTDPDTWILVLIENEEWLRRIAQSGCSSNIGICHVTQGFESALVELIHGVCGAQMQCMVGTDIADIRSVLLSYNSTVYKYLTVEEQEGLPVALMHKGVLEYCVEELVAVTPENFSSVLAVYEGDRFVSLSDWGDFREIIGNLDLPGICVTTDIIVESPSFRAAHLFLSRSGSETAAW